MSEHTSCIISDYGLRIKKEPVNLVLNLEYFFDMKIKGVEFHYKDECIEFSSQELFNILKRSKAGFGYE